MRLRPKSAFFPSTTTMTWCPTSCRGDRRSGYTLVEILVAMTLTLVLMTAVVTVFGGVGDGIAKSRRAMEQFDRLRTAAQQLRMDLQGVTVTLDGRPVRPEEGQGYFEYIEGSYLAPAAINDVTGGTDSTVGERGDILMFTTRNVVKPFLGRYALNVDTTNPTLQSDVAEVAWFLRGKTLHRRVLLVAPGVSRNPSFARLSKALFFAYNDISVRLVNGPNGQQLVPNSLGDLTKRENRFAHPVDTFPFDVRRWGLLGLPTLYECSSQTWMNNWVNGTTPPVNPGPTIKQMDYWDSANIATAFGITSGTASPDQYLAQGTGARLADDIVLTNVIGFDVKAWEPAPNLPNAVNNSGANVPMPGYVDLGYGAIQAGNPSIATAAPIQLQNYTFPQGPTVQRFYHAGVYANPLATTPSYKNTLVASSATFLAPVYDSGCFSTENEGIYHFGPSGFVQDFPGGRDTNGLDDPVPPANNPNGQAAPNGIVDDLSERITSMPYPVPLRGIQIKIRCFEPDSRQVREITIEHDFLPK